MSLNVVPEEAHNIKKNSYIVMKGRPTKISQVAKSKTGKHGHAKIVFDGIDVFTGKKYNDVLPGHGRVMAYELKRMDVEVQMVEEKDRIVEVMNEEGELLQFDIPDNEMGDEFISKFMENEDKGGELVFTVNIVTAPVERGDKFEPHAEMASWNSKLDQ